MSNIIYLIPVIFGSAMFGYGVAMVVIGNKIEAELKEEKPFGLTVIKDESPT